MSMKQFFLFAGERSGDLHGSRLLQALKEHMPTAGFAGVGGPLMRSEGLKNFMPMENFEVMGFTDVIKSLPQLVRYFWQIRFEILEKKPDVVILIDYPGFNLRMAKSLRKHGYTGKIVQYISPTVWAWGKNRVQTMANTLDLLLTIYPFESRYFEETALRVAYVGNPLQEYMLNYNYEPEGLEKLGIKKDRPIIALFPGSRKQEIERNLPVQLHAAAHFKDATIAVSCGHPEAAQLIMDAVKKTILKPESDIFLVPKEQTYNLMKASHAAIAKSGTVTLELALHECPTVVTYQLTALNRFIAKYLLNVNLPYYCIVNLLADCEVFPELIETQPSVEKLSAALDALMHDSFERQRIIEDCRKVKELLGFRIAGRRAAQLIEELL